MDTGTRYIGTVKWFDATKGYGFVTVDEVSDDVFVHQSEIKSEKFDRLYESMRVSFTFTSVDGKRKATDVRGEDGTTLDGHLSTLAFAERLAANPDIKIGAMKWFDCAKHFGFIVPADGSDDVFVHDSEISLAFPNQPIAEGEQVEYKLKVEPKKDGSGDSTKAAEVTAPGGLAIQNQSLGNLLGGPPGQGRPTLLSGPNQGQGRPNLLGVPGMPTHSIMPLHPILPMPPSHAQPSAPATAVMGLGANRQYGTVKWFDATKGFGFILPSTNPSLEIFVHKSKIRFANPMNPVLAQDSQVEFSIEQVPGKNACAVDVTQRGGVLIGSQAGGRASAYMQAAPAAPAGYGAKRKPAYELNNVSPYKTARTTAPMYSHQMAAPMAAYASGSAPSAHGSAVPAAYASYGVAAPSAAGYQPGMANQSAAQGYALPAYSPSLYPY